MFRDHLRKLELPDQPELLLKGTTMVVRMCVSYATMDGQPIDRFLQMQRYDPSHAPDARYAFTFDLHERAFGRVLVDSKMRHLDLADLYGTPWDEFKRVGFTQFWITRTDGARLKRKEMDELHKHILGDIFFDYEEDEVQVGFFPASDRSFLNVEVQDIAEVFPPLRILKNRPLGR